MRRLVNTAGAARLAMVRETTIRKWASNGTLTRYRVHDGQRVHNVYEAREVLEEERRHREHGGGSCAARAGTSQ